MLTAIIAAYVATAAIVIYAVVLLVRFVGNDEAWSSMWRLLRGSPEETAWGRKMLRKIKERAR